MDSPRKRLACGPAYPYNSRLRTTFSVNGADIYAWPSRGGVIIPEDAEAVDFDFLGFDPLNPPMERLDNQSAEDAFCQRLLLLGAKWWDSQARYSIVSEIRDRAQGKGNPPRRAFKLEKQPPPTMREKRIIKAGWPSTGGVWVSEFETTWAGVDEEEDLLDWDEELRRLRMARTMDERCDMLRERFRGRFYADLKDYRGYGFFNAWEEKELGEVGPLLYPNETREIWWKAWGHYPRE
ncbi:MAG: hypothetical protein Q9218_001585 [Villophora microphyllina]